MKGPEILRSGRTILASRVEVTDLHFAKARGLIGQRPAPGQALILVNARQVHTFGMKVPIDVVFCDARWEVLHVADRVRPGRVTKWVRRARYVIELPAGAAAAIGPGDGLSVS